jgi:integrase
MRLGELLNGRWYDLNRIRRELFIPKTKNGKAELTIKK